MPKIFNQRVKKRQRQLLRNQSPYTEKLLWLHLKGKQLDGFKFRRQHSIGLYVVDFYCPDAKLVIEIDGDSHFQEGVEKYDAERQKYIESLGLNVIRFTNDEVQTNTKGVLEAICALLHGNPTRPPLRKGRGSRPKVF